MIEKKNVWMWIESLCVWIKVYQDPAGNKYEPVAADNFAPGAPGSDKFQVDLPHCRHNIL